MAADAVRSLTDMGDIKNLAPLSKQLNTATDELNQALQTIQDRLNGIGIGVEVWLQNTPLRQSDYVDLLIDDEEPTGKREYRAIELGYGRLGDGWALLTRNRTYVEDVTENTIDGYGETDRKALVRSSRELRIAAVPLIPTLIDAIEDEARHALARIAQAKQIADSLE